MKIDEAIGELQQYKKEFGNLEILIPEIIRTQTSNSYHKQTEFNKPKIMVSNCLKDNLCIIIDKDIKFKFQVKKGEYKND